MVRSEIYHLALYSHRIYYRYNQTVDVMDKSLYYLRIAVGVFVGTIILCVLISPDSTLRQPGISFFGSSSSTIVPYSIGLAVTAYFLLRAAYMLSKKNDTIDKIYYRGIALIGVGLLGIVATPAWHTTFILDQMHLLFGISIFIIQVLLVIAYMFTVRKSASDWVLLFMHLSAVLMALFSFNRINLVQLMLPAQLIAILSFSALALRAVKYQLGQTCRYEKAPPRDSICHYNEGQSQ